MGVTDSATTAIMTLLFVGTGVMLYGAILKLQPADQRAKWEGRRWRWEVPEEAKRKKKNLTLRDPGKKWEKLIHARLGK